MKIKQYLLKLKKIKPQTHRIKILRGVLGAIPFIGSFLVEYSPEVFSNNLNLSQEDTDNLLNFINNNKDKKKTWFSSNNECYITIDDKLCEQQGYITIRPLNNEVSLYFLYPFNNTDYFFTLETSPHVVNIKEKTNTYIRLYIHSITKETRLRWFVKGFIKP